MSRRGRRRAREGTNPGPAPSEPHRENVPGELDHASGEVDEFEAGIVAGADGEVAEISEEELAREAEEAFGAGESGDAQAALGGEVEPADAQTALGRPSDADTTGLTPPPGRRPARTTPAAGAATAGRGPGRVFAFFRASWAELQRVQWPDRRQVAQATAVVLGFVVIAGVYLGVADWAAQKVIDFIL
jgi:preprotein translocase subunit SecE